MDHSYDVADPSDWLETPVKQLAPVEAALRCQVCKDFYDTPMITSCSHTFCSLCIRRSLANDGKCPTCRAPDQELRLRRNCSVEELVDVFQVARPDILRLGRDVVGLRTEAGQERLKRKREDISPIERGDEPSPQRRKTRSDSRNIPKFQQADVEIQSESAKDEDLQPVNGLTACPICDRRMKEEDVFLHLDTHRESTVVEESLVNTPLVLRNPISSNNETPVSRSRKAPKPPERIPQLNYSILRDNALRKKFTELGIPNWGARALLIRRHTEWVALVNANCDSSRPRTKRDLLQDLDVWERSQGGHASNNVGALNGGGNLMKKDFDGTAWAVNHDDDFQRLIARARQKSSRDVAVSKSPIKAQKDLDPEPVSYHPSISSNIFQPRAVRDPLTHPVPGCSTNISIGHPENQNLDKGGPQLEDRDSRSSRSVIDLEAKDLGIRHQPESELDGTGNVLA